MAGGEGSQAVPMPNVSQRSGARATGLLALALLVLMALVATSQHGQAVGERVEALDPHVMEGEPFRFNVTVPGVSEPAEQHVQVTCEGCGHVWTTPVLTGWRQGNAPGTWNRTLTFPSSLFGVGPYQEPRWARNYTISVVSAAPTPLATTNVTVHMVDDYLQYNDTYGTGGLVHLRLAGLGAGEHASVNISKWARTGAIVRLATLDLAAGGTGIALYDYTIPRDLARDFDCPHLNGQCHVFNVQVNARNKTETAQFRGDMAVLRANITYIAQEPPDDGLPADLPADPPAQPPPTPLPGPGTYNRTENVTIALDLRYGNNAPLRGEDRNLSSDPSMNGTLKLAIQRIVGPGLANASAPELITFVWAKPTSRGWRATWQIPVNLTATVLGADQPQYRVRVLNQQDKYGNLIADTNASGFRVAPLRIQPHLLERPGQTVERLENATAVFRVRYADGTPWNTTAGQSDMTASLLDGTGDAIKTLPVEYRGNGTWATWFTPDINYKNGFYRLRLDKNQDQWDNEVVANATLPFAIVPASPRVELHTFVGDQDRNETTGFSRGEGFTVRAIVTYPDGSAFNVSRLPQGKANLTLVLHKIDESGLDHGIATLKLEPEGEDGAWSTVEAFNLAELDGQTPIGPWRWDLNVTDRQSPVANVNRTSFVRWVHGAGLEVGFVGQPAPLVRAGEQATVRFTVRYPNGSLLDEGLAGGGLQVSVAPWKDGQAQATLATLLPQFNATRGEWTATWATGSATFVGDYVFTVQGRDIAGNLLRLSLTRPTNVFVDKLLRQVLVEPPEEVHRGEEVLVIFDGAEGDLPEDGRTSPRIELQKWNPLRGAWEAERRDVHVNNANSTDHTGRVLTDTNTNLGQYRFALFARDAQHAAINAASRGFQVLPIELPRAWIGATSSANLTLPKGAALELQLERQQGDRIESVAILKDGQRLANGTSVGRTGRFDVGWVTQHTMPSGAYTVVVRGRDLNNNTFASPAKAFNLTGIELAARQPLPPDAALQRATRIDLKVLIQYPDQQTAKTGNFTARFVLDGETVHAEPLAMNRSVWLGNWTPPASSAVGMYRVLLDGNDAFGNAVSGQELFAFALAEGVLQRDFSLQRLLANRTETISWVLPASHDDTEMHFRLRDEAGAARELNFTLTKAGDYLVQWKPAKDEKLGRYQLQAQGMDLSGNAILGQPRSLLLRPAQIGARFLEPPSAVKPGEEGRWAIQLLYADGTPVPVNADNRPQIAMLAGDRIASPEPQLSIEDGKWVATWTPQAGKDVGVYKLAIGGKDALGNEVQTRYGPNFRIDEGFVKEVLGVPGFEVLLLPLALAGAALATRRRA
jgi:hypothetical protein